MNNQTKLGIGAVLLGAVVALLLRSRTASLLWPINPHIVTSPFGKRINPVTKKGDFHGAVDLAAKIGTPIMAPADGTVTEVLTNSVGGHQLVIKHDNGYQSGYAHLNGYAVKLHDRVRSRQVIAYTGATGRVTGPHLHFVLRNEHGALVNPVNYLT